MSDINERIDRAAESILDNEKLTADLADDAAQVLIDWGIDCAKSVVEGTAGMDDIEAEQAMYAKMRANRRMLRAVNKWVSQQATMSAEMKVKTLEKILSQAAVLYRAGYRPPDRDQQRNFLTGSQALAADAPKMIARLRRFVEKR